MLIFDGHLDLAWNAVWLNRDLTQPIEVLRAAEAWMTERGRGANTVSFPELRRASVELCVATIMARTNPTGRSILDFRSQEITWTSAQAQLAFYRLQCARGRMRRIDNAAHLVSDDKLGFILAMEGADSILDDKDLENWYADGLRIVGPAHYGPGVYAHGTGSPGPLTDCGRALLKNFDHLGIILDATHLAEESFWEAMSLFRGPVLASHSNCRALVPGDRQLSDDQLKCLIERGSVIGVACDVWMLKPGWTYGETKREEVTMSDVADHIDRICSIAGNVDHVAIGSDLDGGYGTEQTPKELDTIADLQLIGDILSNRQYSQEDIAKILHGNWLRFFARAWGGVQSDGYK